jgi:SP family sugar:H+ symporter-like MFS transporter
MAGSVSSSTGPSVFEGAKVNMGFIAAIVAVATIGGFMFGYDSGVVNGTQPGLMAAFKLNDEQLGRAVAAILLGCAVGAFAAGRMADWIGRKTVMIIAAVLFLGSAIAAGIAPGSSIFMVARFIGGLGVGAASVLCPAYISEVTPAGIRGRLSSVQQIMIITGLTGSFVVNYFLAQYAGASTSVMFGQPAWRWMYLAQVIPAGVFLLSLMIIPESPRYLVSKKKFDEAEAVLAKLVGAGEAKRKVDEIRASLAADHRPKLGDLFNKGGLRPIVWVGIGLAVFQQLVGINIIFYYGAVLWQAVGFGEKDSLLIQIGSGTLSILACLFTVAVIDKIGRKPLLLVGSLGMTVTLATMVWCFNNATTVGGHLQLPHQVGLVALVAANAYVVFFNVSWGPVMWVMLGEMFPNQIRGSGLAVAGFFQWIANFGISYSFPQMKDHFSLFGLPPLVCTYAFYAISAAISVWFVAKAVHETKGRELEDMVG